MRPSVGVPYFMPPYGHAAVRVDDQAVTADDALEVPRIVLDDLVSASACSLRTRSNFVARGIDLIERQRVFKKLASIGTIELRRRSFGGRAVSVRVRDEQEKRDGPYQ